MRFIVGTASAGYCPAADSADSITASAPSKMAVATSETSARVGTGLVIMDSSICVATTTGLPTRRAPPVRLPPPRPPPRQLFLNPRSLFERHPDAEIPARHHQRVGEVEDVL